MEILKFGFVIHILVSSAIFYPHSINLITVPDDILYVIQIFLPPKDFLGLYIVSKGMHTKVCNVWQHMRNSNNQNQLQQYFNWAVIENKVALATMLSKKVDINYHIRIGKNEHATPLYIACQHGYFPMLKMLLDCEHIEVNKGREKVEPMMLYKESLKQTFISPLFICVEHEREEFVVSLLFHKDVDIQAGYLFHAGRDKYDSFKYISPLTLAKNLGHKNLIARLRAHCAV